MKISTFLFCLLTPVFLIAQSENDIRSHYNKVNNQIKESIEKGYEGPLYQNQLIINKSSKSWPAVGYYSDTTDFWYYDTPDHNPERNPKTTLVKVTTSRRIAADIKTSQEFLYNDGKLVFYYSYWAEENSLYETRVYYNNTIAFKKSVKKNGIELSAKDLSTKELSDLKPNSSSIISEANKFQELFLKSM